jgi:hypothetical protein
MRALVTVAVWQEEGEGEKTVMADRVYPVVRYFGVLL